MSTKFPTLKLVYVGYDTCCYVLRVSGVIFIISGPVIVYILAKVCVRESLDDVTSGC